MSNLDEKWDETSSPSSRRLRTRGGDESIPVSRSGRLGRNELFSFHGSSLSRYELPPSPKHKNTSTNTNTSRLHTRGLASSSSMQKPSIRKTRGKKNHQPVSSSSPSSPERKEDTSRVIRIEDVVTGQDAIRFFALHGNDSPIKFLHLNRAQMGKEFRPYDLVVVAEKLQNGKPPDPTDPILYGDQDFEKQISKNPNSVSREI